MRIVKKESFHHQAIGVYHNSMIQSLVESWRRREPAGPNCSERRKCHAGRLSRRFEKILLAPDPLHSAAKGALAAAPTE